MAKLRNPLLSLRASGSLGRVVTFLRRNRVNLVEKFPTHKDAKSPAQLFHRNMFSMCVDLWHTLSEAEKRTWESAGTARHMTGYAWYISQCLRPNPGIYLPLAGGTMTGIIEMDGQQVSGLPAPVANNDAVRKVYVDAIPGVYTEGARVYSDANKNIPNGTSTVIDFNLEDYDNDDIHDNVTNNSRLTCQTAGKYLITGNITYTSNATGGRGLFIGLNGGNPVGLTRGQAVNGTITDVQVTTVYDLGIGDYVELYAYQESGIQLASEVWADYAPRFMMQRIG